MLQVMRNIAVTTSFGDSLNEPIRKMCLACSREFDDLSTHCSYDGTALIILDKLNDVESWIRDAVLSGTKYCPVCRQRYKTDSAECERDGGVLQEDKYTTARTLLDEHYEFVDYLGRGGLTDVYLAEDTITYRQVAIKMLNDGMNRDEKTAKRFAEQAMCSSHLEHPAIAATYSSGVLLGKRPYIAMELLSGITLRALVKDEGGLSPDLVVRIFSQVCEGLEHAHKHGVVHKNLKASNIYVCKDTKASASTAKIVDFGLAERLFRDLTWEQQATRTGSVYGDVESMCPEYVRATQPNEVSDIYTMGCGMYEAISGQRIFAQETQMALVVAHMNEKPAPFKDRLSVPEPLAAVVFRCLQKDPSDRFQSAAHVKEALQLCLV